MAIEFEPSVRYDPETRAMVPNTPPPSDEDRAEWERKRPIAGRTTPRELKIANLLAGLRAHGLDPAALVTDAEGRLIGATAAERGEAVQRWARERNERLEAEAAGTLHGALMLARDCDERAGSVPDDCLSEDARDLIEQAEARADELRRTAEDWRVAVLCFIHADVEVLGEALAEAFNEREAISSTVDEIKSEAETSRSWVPWR